MPATGTAADAGYTLDAFLKANTSIGNVKSTAATAKSTADTAKAAADSAAAKANTAVQSIKINGVTKTATDGVVDLGTITGGTTTTLTTLTAGMIAGAI